MRIVLKSLKWLALLLLALLALAAAILLWHLARSQPKLEGAIDAPGLSAPVSVVRDGGGVPTIAAATRADAALALGYLHAQERFFQMDTLRRASSGRLSALMGDATEKIDRAVLPHRFGTRAGRMVAAMSPAERAFVASYTAGVNHGLAALGSAPFDYALLWAEPAPWTAEDTVLTGFSMYLNLQPAKPGLELDRALAERRGGRALAELLYPSGTELDAPLDGLALPSPPLPARLEGVKQPIAEPMGSEAAEQAVLGSNNWAVAGPLSTSGAALVANDMHLGLSVPGTWYRARIIVRPAASAAPALDITGVTLPGSPGVVAGSNGRIAWGFTNSYIDTADAVVIEPVPGRAGFYRTPDGPRPIVRATERLCLGGNCSDFPVEETIWGPIIGTDAFGRRIAMRWTAHDPGAIRLLPSLALEAAGSVAEAIAIAQRAAIPHQNLVVGDSAGNIGWTIMGQVPARFGFDGRHAASWADGSRGWRGYLAPGKVPSVINPGQGRIWTANSRVIGGNAYARLGDGGYDTGSRAGRIRDLLFARDRFAPADFLSIQLDDQNNRNAFWQPILLAELRKRRSEPRLAAMIVPVERWGGRALPDSVGYRLVSEFRTLWSRKAHEAYLGGKPEDRPSYARPQGEGGMRALARARPAALVPPGHRDWDAFLTAVLKDLTDKVDGDLDGFTWGATNTANVRHPLSAAIPGLAWLTDPRDRPVPGDSGVVRAHGPGFGASERFAVSPGHERDGIFHMPGSQSAHPWSPYYLTGHDAWLHGRPAPFLPGPPRWRLELRPSTR